MEIKIYRYVFFILCIGAFSGISANDEINIASKKLISVNTENKIFDKNLSTKDPLKDVLIDFNKIVYRSNNANFEKNIEKVNFNSSKVELRNELILNKNEYFLIQTKDNQKLIYDGSLLIKFIDIPNFQDYAAMNDLIFIKDLSDINTAIFKVYNFLDLKIIIDNLKSDSDVKSIELNTINPNLKPK